MVQQLRRYVIWLALLILPVLIATGCALPGTAVSSNPEPTVSPNQIDLTAVETIVERLRGDDPVRVQRENTVDILINDRIAVDESGLGLLNFHQDRLLVEIFRGSEVHLAEARLDAEGFIFVRMKQAFGTTRAELNDLAEARVELKTEYATITALGGDTEILVCHAPAVTCMATLVGTAQVEALGEVVTVKAGEATYIFPGEPPRPALCSNQEELNQWIEKKRTTEELPPLGRVVADWPQEPCQAQASATSAPAADAPTPTSAPAGSGLATPDGMIKIVADRYQIGGPDADDYHLAAQEIDLSQFWIDQHEVTNAQYQIFLDVTGNTPPVNWPSEANHPVQGVSWGQADTYCTWINKRLPTEAEWEVAGRGPGPESPLYPWGSDPSAGGKAFNLPLDGTYEVGSQPFNVSPFGLYDMAGNVWEWVGEPYGPIPDGYKIVRGGRYGLLRDMAYRQESQPNDERFVAVAGFRCAADQVEGE